MYTVKLKRKSDYIYPNITTILKEKYTNVEELHFYNTYIKIKLFGKKEYIHLYLITSIKIKHTEEKSK